MALAATACVRDTRVRGPDGEDAHSLTCSTAEQCYQRAARLCVGGYVIRNSGATAMGFTPNGTGSVSSRVHLLVSCKADLAAASPEPEPEKSEDEQACESAHREASDFADYYARLTPHGKRLDSLPTRRDFVAVCRKLPENVRTCLRDRYREDHAKACDAVLTRLDPRDRDRIDGLFFEATVTGTAPIPSP
ncbi:MAG: hypothetical protein ACLQVI_23465 [Polyangiaceae bacterium]